MWLDEGYFLFFLYSTLLSVNDNTFFHRRIFPVSRALKLPALPAAGAERRTHAPHSAADLQRFGGDKAAGGKAAPSWMGLQTKGPSKGVRGAVTAGKPMGRPKRGAPAVTPYTSSPKDAPGRVKSGKRPAVASRKLAKSPGGASGGVAKPKSGRASIKQPRK